MTLSIRDAINSDKAEILRLVQGLSNESNIETPLTIRYISKYLSSPCSHILLAEKEKRVVGLLSYSVRPDLWHAAMCCFIEEIVVKASERERGIGTELLIALIDRVKKKNYAEISITVMPKNKSAQRLYKLVGINEEVICLEKHFSK
jgi:ribosomal protein S18 acetylase RimI-like enzyme